MTGFVWHARMTASDIQAAVARLPPRVAAAWALGEAARVLGLCESVAPGCGRVRALTGALSVSAVRHAMGPGDAPDGLRGFQDAAETLYDVVYQDAPNDTPSLTLMFAAGDRYQCLYRAADATLYSAAVCCLRVFGQRNRHWPMVGPAADYYRDVHRAAVFANVSPAMWRARGINHTFHEDAVDPAGWRRVNALYARARGLDGLAFAPEWRTDTVVALARRLAADPAAAPTLVPILADALADAGCPAETHLAALRDDPAHFLASDWAFWGGLGVVAAAGPEIPGGGLTPPLGVAN
jgi:hypothetical protein